MTVILNGVSLTKVRLHDWHAEVDTALTVAPAVIVTAVGAVADAMGMVQVPLSGCDLVLQQPPLQGTYEMIPCTRIVAAYCPVPTCDTPTNENCGAKTGVFSAQVGKHSRCVMLSW